MKSGKCPKCESQEVHIVSSLRTNLVIPLGLLADVAHINLYVCAQCGYVEIYAHDIADLPEIAAKWPKVTD